MYTKKRPHDSTEQHNIKILVLEKIRAKLIRLKSSRVWNFSFFLSGTLTNFPIGKNTYNNNVNIYKKKELITKSKDTGSVYKTNNNNTVIS